MLGPSGKSRDSVKVSQTSEFSCKLMVCDVLK